MSSAAPKESDLPKDPKTIAANDAIAPVGTGSESQGERTAGANQARELPNQNEKREEAAEKLSAKEQQLVEQRNQHYRQIDAMGMDELASDNAKTTVDRKLTTATGATAISAAEMGDIANKVSGLPPHILALAAAEGAKLNNAGNLSAANGEHHSQAISMAAPQRQPDTHSPA